MVKLHTLRLTQGQDLKVELEKFAADNQIKAGFVVTCVGILKNVVVRMPGATPEKQNIKNLDGPFEIVSLVGTLSADNNHLHISVADQTGTVVGGHLKVGSLVSHTAEIVIGEDENRIYERVLDPQTGFDELVVKNV